MNDWDPKDILQTLVDVKRNQILLHGTAISILDEENFKTNKK